MEVFVWYFVELFEEGDELCDVFFFDLKDFEFVVDLWEFVGVSFCGCGGVSVYGVGEVFIVVVVYVWIGVVILFEVWCVKCFGVFW